MSSAEFTGHTDAKAVLEARLNGPAYLAGDVWVLMKHMRCSICPMDVTLPATCSFNNMLCPPASNGIYPMQLPSLLVTQTAAPVPLRGAAPGLW